MSRCNMINVEDIGPMCTVHGGPVPCPSNGQPALWYPMHAFTEHDRLASVDQARFVTAGFRPILLHHGSPADEAPAHDATIGSTDCWCAPVTIPSG